MTATISFYFNGKTVVDFPLGTKIAGRGVCHIDDESGVSTYSLTPMAVAKLRSFGWSFVSHE